MAKFKIAYASNAVTIKGSAEAETETEVRTALSAVSIKAAKVKAAKASKSNAATPAASK